MKIKDKFTELKIPDEGALITHICAGDRRHNQTQAPVLRPDR